MLRRISHTTGFTLMEMMLVVIIIGVLAAIVLPNLVGRTQHAKVMAAKAQLSTLSTTLDLYEMAIGAYPTTSQGLLALIQEPDGATGWKGPYLKSDQVPLDPWGINYQYVCPGTHNKSSYDLWSYGRDGKDGGGDDIANFSAEAK